MDPPLPEPSNCVTRKSDHVIFPQGDGNRLLACDAKRLKELRDFKEAEFLLKQSKLVAGLIQSAKSLFRSENILMEDGNNFGDWYWNLVEVGRACLTSVTFFFEKCDNTTFEKIGRAVLIGSIDRSHVAEMQKFIDADGHNAGISSGLKDLLSEWTSLGVKFGTNTFLGLIDQAAVMELGAQYKSNFELKVENLVQADKKGGCPTFEAVINALDICKEQHRNITEIAASGPAFTSSQPPSALIASAGTEDTFDVLAYLAEVNHLEWVDALDFYALTANTCWHCGGGGHYARKCQEKAKGATSNNQFSQPVDTIVGTIYGQLPSGFLVHSGRFPRMNFCRTPTPPTRNQQHA
ncbi:hypothetical protein PTTG_25490 [Puccinia triticina 1-1 BBBD Race 1]|uniref:CCHC-type domain-containing protein n=1 Tax=Puccinia triticina (isolate 1-1 / race 1 (BBBD)) TaxID=630390 RepID=A0A180H120_PUCT1|nr:hypothetical protein PTTG_25490 [Puccinia triticina 1-1 BBBD Race 1]